MKTNFLTAADVAGIASHVGVDALMDLVIERLRDVFSEPQAKQTYSVPERDGFKLAGQGEGLFEWMPILEAGTDVTFKLVSYVPDNPRDRGRPSVQSISLCFDGLSGHVTGVADTTLATALRTGAASAIASSILAIPGASSLGLIGAGAQAVTQLHALSRTFELERVLVFDSDERVSASFEHRVRMLNLKQTAIEVASRREVAQCDIVCTATSVPVGAGPVLDGEPLVPHVHINAVGSDFPGKVEIPRALLKQSFVCPDFLPQARKEGECQQLERHEIGPDIIDLVHGERQYESYQQKKTIFDSTGFALEDHVTLRLLQELGLQLGIGHCIDVQGVAGDPKDTYANLS